MRHIFLPLTTFTLSMVLIASPVGAQQSPPKEPEKLVVVQDTGGEWVDAHEPDLAKAVATIVDRTNAFRKEQKREPVSIDEELTKAAQDFAEYMADTGRYGHSADDRTPAERAKAAGYEFCTVRENIAYAFRSKGFKSEELADQFFTGWKQSPGHRRNMLAEWVVDTGVAIAQSKDTDTYFAVQLFGRPESKRMSFEIANRSDHSVEYRVDEQSYTVDPRVVRTHATCEPVQVSFMPLVSKEETSDPVRPVKRVAIKGGERMTIETSESSYRVNVEQSAKP